MQLEFTIPGKPIPCDRPRFAKHAYKTTKDRNYQKGVAMMAKLAMNQKGMPILMGDVSVSLDIHCWLKGDIDNFAKNITDGMLDVVYADDVQITFLQVYLTRHDVSEKAQWCATVRVWDTKTGFYEVEK